MASILTLFHYGNRWGGCISKSTFRGYDIGDFSNDSAHIEIVANIVNATSASASLADVLLVEKSATIASAYGEPHLHLELNCLVYITPLLVD
jgi:hypothetical protein